MIVRGSFFSKDLLCSIASILVLISAMAGGEAFGDRMASSESASERSWFGKFQVGAMFALVSGRSGYSLAPQVSWNPTFSIGPKTSVRGDIGLSAMKVSSASSTSIVAQAQLLLSFSIDRQVLELGGGIE